MPVAKRQLVFADRLLAILIRLRHSAAHDVLACRFGVDRSTLTRVIGEVRPLLARRGCTVAPDVRLRILAEVVGHLGASGQTGIMDGTEIRVRRPAAGRKDPGRLARCTSPKPTVASGCWRRCWTKRTSRRAVTADCRTRAATACARRYLARLNPCPGPA
ncbi:helix-turn-helix domain-containing protein [Streptomyces decoyicus]